MDCIPAGKMKHIHANIANPFRNSIICNNSTFCQRRVFTLLSDVDAITPTSPRPSELASLPRSQPIPVPLRTPPSFHSGHPPSVSIRHSSFLDLHPCSGVDYDTDCEELANSYATSNTTDVLPIQFSSPTSDIIMHDDNASTNGVILPKEGTDVNTDHRLDNANRESLLWMAAKGEITNLQRFVNEKRYAIHEIDDLGSNALFYASSYGQSKALQLLINCGIKVNHLNNLGQSTLMIACAEEDEDIVDILIANGAIVNICDKTGTTPLMYATNTNNFRIVSLLLLEGADVLPKNNNAISAYSIAVNYNYRAIQSIMEEHLGEIF